GIGFSIILLQTFTKIYITIFLVLAQVLGTVIIIVAKATALDVNRPKDVFLDFLAGVVAGLKKP
ncbi:hypothetical protein DM02DRAFT_540526, partial [Periconia macrospinosa]